MDKPISAGDLVVIVKPRRCGCAETIGTIFVVEKIGRSPRGGYCRNCGNDTYPKGEVRTVDGDRFTELARLKRIPPLDELESEKRREEITA